MKTLRRKTIIGLFADTADARRAVYDLEHNGFSLSEVSVILREREVSRYSHKMAGTLLSLSAPTQASTTAMDVGQAPTPPLTPSEEPDGPAFGPMVAAGPLAQGMGGAALGKSAGGLSGTLSDIGIPNHVAREIVDRTRAGEVALVCIQVARASSEKAEGVFLDNGAETVYRSTDHTGDYSKGEAAALAAERGL